MLLRINMCEWKQKESRQEKRGPQCRSDDEGSASARQTVPDGPTWLGLYAPSLLHPWLQPVP